MAKTYIVRCGPCGTKVEKDSIEEAAEVATEHDENRHDGQGVPTINGMPVPSDEVADAATDALETIGAIDPDN